MPDLPSSSSFIPKRTAGTKIRQKRTRNFFLLSIISYACLIAAPTASAAVYVYQIYTDRQFEQLVTSLDEAIGSFSEAEMARVLEFATRLESAEKLVNNHVSVVRALESLEQTTATEVGFRSLTLLRNPDGSLRIAADILASDFDAALFQRGAYKNQNVPIANATLDDIAFVPPSDVGEGERVMMTGIFDFSVSDIQFSISENSTTEPLPETSTSESSVDNGSDAGAVDSSEGDISVDAEEDAVIEDTL
ncbi:MAG: hypothetical protein MUF19_03560 [Candidatus Pacebacteria bacterium]|jgi:hypothetical protein|nr:hypothetical protein [Candidatus Paceibacterota bacterium]